MKIDGYITIGGSDLVKVKIDDKTLKYYDLNTGLLERSEETMEVEGNSITTSRKFSDYKDVCLLYTSPSPRDRQKSRMPSSA